MKKFIISFLFCVILLTLCVYASDTLRIVCGSITAQPGETVDIIVSITDNPGFMFLVLTPEYDADALSVNISNGTLISDLTQGKQLVWTADEDVSATGILCTLSVNVKDTAAPGQYSVKLINRGCYDQNENTVPVNIENGGITVTGSEDEAIKYVKTGGSITVTETPSNGKVIAVFYSDKGKMIAFKTFNVGEAISNSYGASLIKLILTNNSFVPLCKAEYVL